MEGQEKEDERDVNVLNSMLMIAMENNVTLNACLEVLMGIRMDGKSDEEKQIYNAKMNERIKELRKDSRSLLFRIERPK